MAFRFEFDPVNKILLAHFEGQLTNESAGEYHDALGKNWRAEEALTKLGAQSAHFERLE